MNKEKNAIHPRNLLSGICSCRCETADPRQKHSGERLKGVGPVLDPALRPCGTGSYGAPLRSGFTLIELLVVVLIIGILAAVAVPQYQKAVEKSKAAQAFAMIRTVAAAQEAYHMANGAYATQFDELAVDIPWTGTTRLIYDNSSSHDTGVRSNQDWSLQIYREAAGNGIFIGRISGPYSGAGFLYLLNSGYNFPTHAMLCFERSKSKTDFPFNKDSGDYCEKIMRGSYVTGSGGFWLLP